MKYILFNSQTKNQKKDETVKRFQNAGENDLVVKDVLELNYSEFFKSLQSEDVVYLVGGDGTVNYLANAMDCNTIKNDIYLIPSGTGNDLFNDMKKGDQEELLLNPYLKNLPTVEVNGVKKKFINGVGFGIDGYCCEKGDELRAKQDKPVNYTSIAIKGLLFHFKPVNATIKVDGKEYQYKHVWLAPTMKGRFYGGGMMIAPNQDRLEEGVVTNVVYISKSKLKALMVFPSIFKGEHVKKEKMVKIVKGKEIEVIFDRPTSLQIDGETYLNVLSYKVQA